MRTNDIEPIGAEVTDVTIGELPAATVAALRTLLAQRGVLVFRDQQIDDDDFVAFLRSFGELTFTVGETPVDGHPELNVVTNVNRTTPPRSEFHVDTSYVRRPPAYTALRAVTVPAEGGETLFSNQYRAYETLPDELRSALEGRVITHVVTGVMVSDGDEQSADHPVFRPHPVSGRPALYLSTPSRCAAVSGMDADAAAAVVRRLLELSTRPDNLYRHRWSEGDVVMWDNGCVLHRADHSGVSGDRTMHRGMVAG